MESLATPSSLAAGVPRPTAGAPVRGEGEREGCGPPTTVHPGRPALEDRRAATDNPQMDIRVSEVVAALSHALDVTHGQPPGHATRSCLIGMRIAGALGLDADARSSLFYALLLKNAGCSTNASKIVALSGPMTPTSSVTRSSSTSAARCPC